MDTTTTATPATLTLALWPVHVAHPLDDLGAWLAMVDARLAEAAAAGADLLMLPEYACMQWLAFAPGAVPPEGEVAWMAEQAEVAAPALADLAIGHGIALLAGTMPARVEAGRAGTPGTPSAGSDAPAACYRNRAYLFLPDGDRSVHVTQDKLCMTPTEREAEGWWLEPGDTVRVVEWRGLRLAVVVCLDIELPALAARLQHLDLDLVLVPSMTSRLSGHHRVHRCARARAVELFTVVATAGTVGTHARLGNVTPNVGGAAVFLPCEAALGSTGVAARFDPIAEAEGPGPLVVARDVPVGLVRRLRHDGLTEAWPGPWEADHVRVSAPPVSRQSPVAR